MRRAALMLGWLCGGHALAGGLYVGLLNTPEASVWMLALSLLLGLAVVATVGVTDGTAVTWLQPGARFREAVGPGVRRGVPGTILATVLFGLIWAASVRLEAWHAAHAGEIDAWLIASFDTTRSAWIHRGIAIVLLLVRSVLGVSMAVAALAAVVMRGLRGLASAAWIRAAFSRDQLGATGLVVVLLMGVPWLAVHWRPAWIPPTTVEVAFVAVKLSLIYLLAHLGWALILHVAGRTARGRRGERDWVG